MGMQLLPLLILLLQSQGRVDAQPAVPTCTIPKLPSDFEGRSLLENGTEKFCSICDPFDVRRGVVPNYIADDETLQTMTCETFEFVSNRVPDGSEQCSQLANLFPQCCHGPPTYTCELNVRKHIFDDQEYVAAIAPIVDSTTQPLVVNVNLVFNTVKDIDVQKGTAEFFVTLALSWRDPRLTWSVSKDKCAYIIAVNEEEIWVPDFDLVNQVSGVQSFPHARAMVTQSGLVQWVRTGPLEAICQFQGLAQIPFDTLGCQLLMGPQERRGNGQMVFELANGTGLEFVGFEAVYNEYLVVPHLSESGHTRKGTVVYYNFYFSRAEHFYMFNVVIPTIILTYVSFGTFLLDLRTGERLGYIMALALVIVAQQIVTGSLIPVSNERLWIDKFVGWSFYWVIVGLVQSVVTGYVFFLREDAGKPGEGQQAKDDVNDKDSPSGENFGRVSEAVEQSDNMGQQGGVESNRHCFFTFSLRKVDHCFFIMSTLTYTFYVIAMFTSIERWGSKVDPVYFDEGDSDIFQG